MEIIYHDLTETISFDGFSFSDYLKGEREILTPRLKEKGYTDIEFWMGEYDSFGPLSRVCRALNPDGAAVFWVYG